MYRTTVAAMLTLVFIFVIDKSMAVDAGEVIQVEEVAAFKTARVE